MTFPDLDGVAVRGHVLPPQFAYAAAAGPGYAEHERHGFTSEARTVLRPFYEYQGYEEESCALYRALTRSFPDIAIPFLPRSHIRLWRFRTQRPGFRFGPPDYLCWGQGTTAFLITERWPYSPLFAAPPYH